MVFPNTVDKYTHPWGDHFCTAAVPLISAVTAYFGQCWQPRYQVESEWRNQWKWTVLSIYGDGVTVFFPSRTELLSACTAFHSDNPSSRSRPPQNGTACCLYLHHIVHICNAIWKKSETFLSFYITSVCFVFAMWYTALSHIYSYRSEDTSHPFLQDSPLSTKASSRRGVRSSLYAPRRKRWLMTRWRNGACPSRPLETPRMSSWKRLTEGIKSALQTLSTI